MQSLTIYDGSCQNTPLYHVYFCSLKGSNAVKVSVRAQDNATWPQKLNRGAEVAIEKALHFLENMPRSAFIAVYRDDPTPKLTSSKTRSSDPLDPNAEYFRARRIKINAKGFDKGGAFWEKNHLDLFEVQDGLGNIAFINAKNANDAINRLTQP